MTGITVNVDQPALTIEVSDAEAVVAAGQYLGITLDTLNLQGPAGQGAFQHVHDQPSAATVWSINHNLGGYPNVTVVDSAGGLLWPSVDYVDVNTITVTHAKPYAGVAYLS